MDEKKLLTVGEIAKRLDCPIHKILYLIETRQIKPIQRAGCLRIFNDEVLEILRAELQRKSTVQAEADLPAVSLPGQGQSAPNQVAVG